MAKGTVARTRTNGNTRRSGVRAAAHPRRASGSTTPTTPSTSPTRRYRGLYRDLVLVRRLDAEATALQRQGELGIWASLLGQEAAQVGSGRALRTAGHGLPDLPRARRCSTAGASTRSCRSACSAASTTAAGTRTSSSSTCTRSSSARRPCTRPATPWASPWTAGRRDDGEARHRLLRRRRHQPGRRQRGVRLGQRLQRAGRVLLPEQPVGDLRAARAADPRPAVPAGRAASASPASGWTATTCSPASR